MAANCKSPNPGPRKLGSLTWTWRMALPAWAITSTWDLFSAAAALVSTIVWKLGWPTSATIWRASEMEFNMLVSLPVRASMQ